MKVTITYRRWTGTGKSADAALRDLLRVIYGDAPNVCNPVLETVYRRCSQHQEDILAALEWVRAYQAVSREWEAARTDDLLTQEQIDRVCAAVPDWDAQLNMMEGHLKTLRLAGGFNDADT